MRIYRHAAWVLIPVLLLGGFAAWLFYPMVDGDQDADSVWRIAERSADDDWADFDLFPSDRDHLPPSRRIPARNVMPADAPEGAVPDELLLRFRTREELDLFLSEANRLGTPVLGSSTVLRTVRVQRSELESEDRLRALADDAAVEHNYYAYTPDLPPAPTIGNHRPFGRAAAGAMGFPEARDHWGRGVRVALLDTMVAVDHPAFAGKALRQFDLIGTAATDSPYRGHGTAVASILGGDSSYGPALAPAAEMLHFRVLDDDGIGETFTIANGIIEAVEQGARVISLSLGSHHDSGVLRDAVRYAADRGVALVASAGNHGLEDGIFYPARYEEVVSVGAVDADRIRPAFSNQGPQADIAAAGVGVRSASIGGSDEAVAFSGTSASAPFVAGAIAGLLSEYPELDPARAVALLREHADDAGRPGPDSEYGHGILNVQRVLERDIPGIRDAAIAGVWVDPQSNASTTGGGTGTTLTVSVQNRGTESLSGVSLTVHFSDGSGGRFDMGSMEPREVLSRQVELPPEFGAEGRAIMDAWVEIADEPDSRPENNLKRLILERVSDADAGDG